jgi:SAM-dependent methyltransferase
MSDWTSGYVTDVEYTFGYYTELNPLRLKLAFLNAGLDCPAVGAACELGFGQGMSANLHAAASHTTWSGTDFNPSQAGFASELAQISGSGAQLFDQGFAEYCNRDDLPDFDYIGLHGIWSWISNENRQIIVDFIRRKLKVGGVLYISYNTLPGWSAMAPMRHLMTGFAERMSAPGSGIVAQVDSALGFCDRLLATNPLYARANPQVAERFGKMKGQNRRYLAHEYFNRDWLPMHFTDMADWLQPAKMSFACSANYLDHIDGINLSGEQQKLLADIPDPVFKQQVRDFMVNQQFRKDYWVKGPRKLNKLEQGEKLGKERVVLIQPRDDVAFEVSGTLGKLKMQEAIYKPLLDCLADHKPKTISAIEAELKTTGITAAQMVQGLVILTGSGALASAHDDKTIRALKDRTDRLNAHIIAKSRGNSEFHNLASPVTGGGIVVDRFQQLFLAARAGGENKPEEWARIAFETLKIQGQRILQDGKTLETDAENRDYLSKMAKTFADKILPVLVALKVV